jgi:hypothetical protein
MTNTTVRNLLDSMHQVANENAIESLVNDYGFANDTAIKLVTEFDGNDFDIATEASF